MTTKHTDRKTGITFYRTADGRKMTVPDYDKTLRIIERRIRADVPTDLADEMMEMVYDAIDNGAAF